MTLKDYIVSEETTLLETLRVIDKNSCGIAFVCDEKELLAVVSDGDVRRSLMNGANMDTPVSQIANYKPIFLRENDRRKAVEIMKEKEITVLPILNNDHEIIDIKCLLKDIMIEKHDFNIPVVIMAGGKGTRLKPYTDILPKPLIPIGDKTITERIMDKFQQMGCTDIYMILNYKKNLIKSYFIDALQNEEICGLRLPVFIEEDKFLGTGGGLSLLTKKISGTFILTNCDILVDADYEKILQKHKFEKNIITIICARKKTVIPYGTVEVGQDGNVIKFKEKPSFEFYTNTGLYLIESTLLEDIPQNTSIDITDIIISCINEGKRVGVYLVDEEDWLDMGQFEELKKMEKRFEV